MNHVQRAAGAAAVVVSFVLAGGAAALACSSSSASHITQYTDGGPPSGASTTPIVGDAGQVQAFPQGGPPDPGAGGIYVTISGESNAITGYPFPPGDFTNDTYMFDGWQFVIKEYIVNVANVTLWSDPNLNATNQQQHGPQVAHLAGPFVVDLHKGGSIIGQGGAPEEATAIGTITNQNDNGGAAFDPATTYGFGFSTVQASYAGYNVNLDPTEFADFDYMVQHGYSVLYVGSATWLGDKSPYPCTQTNAGAGPVDFDGGVDAAGVTYVDGGYDFTKMPPTMNFRLGFATPTNYVNCQNFTAMGMGIGGEDSPRGIQVSTSQSAIAQITVHMDHPFWESFAEDTPVHWDQIAAQYVGASGVPEAHVEDFVGVPFNGFKDKTGTPLPWRNCAGMFYTPPGNGQMNFSTLSVPQDPGGTCTGSFGVDYTKDTCPGIRDYYDYIRYTQSTQGHLNSQGLCFIDRQYPAPAGGS